MNDAGTYEVKSALGNRVLLRLQHVGVGVHVVTVCRDDREMKVIGPAVSRAADVPDDISGHYRCARRQIGWRYQVVIVILRAVIGPQYHIIAGHTVVAVVQDDTVRDGQKVCSLGRVDVNARMDPRSSIPRLLPAGKRTWWIPCPATHT